MFFCLPAAFGHFSLEIGVDTEHVCSPTCGPPTGQTSISRIAYPGETVYVGSRVANLSDVYGLSDLSMRDTLGGELWTAANLPAGVEVIGHRSYTAPTVSGPYSSTARVSARSTNGIVYSQSVTYELIVPDVEIDTLLAVLNLTEDCPDWESIGMLNCPFAPPISGAPEVHADAGQVVGVVLMLDVSPHSAPIDFIDLEDSLAGSVLSDYSVRYAPGGQLPFVFSVQAPDFAGTYEETAEMTASDQFGNSATAMHSYTIVVDTSVPDPDGDGMHSDYELANGLDPLVHDAFLDLDRDGDDNFLESLFGTAANDPTSRALVRIRRVSPAVVELRWPTVPGHHYSLQSGPSLAGMTERLNLDANLSEAIVQLPVDEASAFFRVVGSVP